MKEPEVKSFSQAVAPINSTGIILKIILTEEGGRALCRGFLPFPLGRILGKKPGSPGKKKKRRGKPSGGQGGRGGGLAGHGTRHQSLVAALRNTCTVLGIVLSLPQGTAGSLGVSGQPVADFVPVITGARVPRGDEAWSW